MSIGFAAPGSTGQEQVSQDAVQRDQEDLVLERDWLPSIHSGRRSLKLAGSVAVGAVLAGLILWLLPTRIATHSLEPWKDHHETLAFPVGTPGSEWLDEYAKLNAHDPLARHRLVLEQVAKGNMPDTWNRWVTVTITGSKGTVVEFEVSPHGLRIGTTSDWVEVPLDGPHFAAAAEILGYRLATAWMVEQTYLQAKARGGAIHYFAADEIAHSMGYKDWKRNAPDGRKMKDVGFFRQRSLLLRRWLESHHISGDTLVSGYFKSVVPPLAGLLANAVSPLL